MTPPKIYIRKDPCTGELAESWQEEPHVKYDTVFFSEEHVRQILRKVVDDANHLIDISTTLHKTKLDSEKYIPHVIDLLMKGGENGKETD